jgi:hypothetical protein
MQDLFFSITLSGLFFSKTSIPLMPFMSTTFSPELLFNYSIHRFCISLHFISRSLLMKPQIHSSLFIFFPIFLISFYPHLSFIQGTLFTDIFRFSFSYPPISFHSTPLSKDFLSLPTVSPDVFSYRISANPFIQPPPLSPELLSSQLLLHQILFHSTQDATKQVIMIHASYELLRSCKKHIRIELTMMNYDVQCKHCIFINQVPESTV